MPSPAVSFADFGGSKRLYPTLIYLHRSKKSPWHPGPQLTETPLVLASTAPQRVRIGRFFFATNALEQRRHKERKSQARPARPRTLWVDRQIRRGGCPAHSSAALHESAHREHLDSVIAPAHMACCLQEGRCRGYLALRRLQALLRNGCPRPRRAGEKPPSDPRTCRRPVHPTLCPTPRKRPRGGPPPERHGPARLGFVPGLSLA
jgi:hypothetical protein